MTEQHQACPGGTPTRIGQAVMLLHVGDREEARQRFAALWAETADSCDALHRCTLAHYMADAQDDPEDELAWDLRALALAEGDGRDGRARGEALALRVLKPSLHLSLAADYLKLRRPEAARDHLDRARATTGALADDGYGHGVRAEIARLGRALGPG
ncbi:hypothetical protein [Streptomyces sp. C10-9-1]|uniref:hypothetical protein n=1 Tax=Streptomyces sp. C10-9-1 TaxID=1859285 RepID=UPI003D741CE4